MSYKLLACDFDDTLFSSSRTISVCNREAIDRCESRGVKFVLATGRTFSSIEPYYKNLGLKTPVIVSGGAEVYDKNGQRIFMSGLPDADALSLLKRAKALGVHAQVYSGNMFYYDEYRPEIDYYAFRTGLKGKLIPELLNMTEFNTPKLLMVTEECNINSLENQLRSEFPHLNAVKSNNRFIEFFDKSTSKGNALKFLMESYGYLKDETAAVGDTQIDISMIKAAGLGAAPANSMPDVLAAADIILNDCDHDCVAQLLEEYIFHD